MLQNIESTDGVEFGRIRNSPGIHLHQFRARHPLRREAQSPGEDLAPGEPQFGSAAAIPDRTKPVPQPISSKLSIPGK
jgi:hypothetical protein